jgi:hypothetical protein
VKAAAAGDCEARNRQKRGEEESGEWRRRTWETQVCVCVRALFLFLFLFPEFGECFAVHFNHTLDSDLLEDTDICLSWKL